MSWLVAGASPLPSGHFLQPKKGASNMTVYESAAEIRRSGGDGHDSPKAMTFSYLDVAGRIVEDWQVAHGYGSGSPEDVADAIIRSFSVEQLRAYVWAHLLLESGPR